jgi:hypothetical protein
MRNGQLHVPEREAATAADVHGVPAAALADAVVDDLEVRDDDSVRPLRDLHRVSDVVAVTVCQQDGVQLVERVGTDLGQFVSRQERVDQHPVLSVGDLPARVTVKV